MKVILRKALAFFFLFIGALGVFLPVLPGVVFIVLGLSFLGADSRLRLKIKSLLQKFKKTRNLDESSWQ
jgi:uncharacterized membrane protein YbaN (DUF454 family)